MADASSHHPDNEQYWIDRHEQLRGSLASVGNIGSKEWDNIERYARKKRRIAMLLKSLNIDLEGKAVLDAGCGIGMMTELFYAFGATIWGVDASETALIEAKHRAPGGTFRATSLTEFRFQQRFDAIFCLDVLYHVIDDMNWKKVLTRFREHLKPGGLLVIIDQHKAESTQPAAHVHFRTEQMYDGCLLDLDRLKPKGHDYALVYRNGR
jgi:2-polyprenyl-3-methyl-5-hydroxy-6-metoxy-1,4-benzoquinol methylase